MEKKKKLKEVKVGEIQTGKWVGPIQFSLSSQDF